MSVDIAGLARARSRTVGVALEIAVAEFALADLDTARQRSVVVANSVVGDFEVMSPAVDENAAAALGTVGDQQAIDPRRIALEVARERVGNVVPIAGSASSAIGGRQERGAGGISGFRSRLQTSPSRRELALLSRAR